MTDDNVHLQWFKSEIERRRNEEAKNMAITTSQTAAAAAWLAPSVVSMGQTNQTFYTKEVTLRVVECENGYMIFANNGQKSITRIATSETLNAEMNACMVSLKLE